MPLTHELIQQIATNRANIANMESVMKETKARLDMIEGDIVELRGELRVGLQSIIARLDANKHQLEGASKLAKFLKDTLPIICSVIAYFAGKYSH